MNKTYPELVIFPIHASGKKMVLAITGGGTEVIGELLRFGGGSHTLLEAVVPYDNASFCNFIGGKPDKFCSEAAARQLAMAAFQRALFLKSDVDVNDLYGVGVTASLSKFNERQGRKNHFYVALQNSKLTVSYSVNILPDSNLSRPEQEKFVSDYVLSLLLMNFCEKNEKISNLIHKMNSFVEKHVEITKIVSCDNNTEVLLNQKPFCNIKNPDNLNTKGRVIFSGSFNPYHQAHDNIVRKAAQLTGKKVDLEISIRNVDKPILDYVDINNRISSIEKHNNECIQDIFLTNLPTFAEKANHFKDSTFVVGWDTFIRIADEKYKNLNRVFESFEDNDVKFLVFHRIMNGVKSWEQKVEITHAFNRLIKFSKIVDPDEFILDISSSVIRKQNTDN